MRINKKTVNLALELLAEGRLDKGLGKLGEPHFKIVPNVLDPTTIEYQIDHPGGGYMIATTQKAANKKLEELWPKAATTKE